MAHFYSFRTVKSNLRTHLFCKRLSNVKAAPVVLISFYGYASRSTYFAGSPEAHRRFFRSGAPHPFMSSQKSLKRLISSALVALFMFAPCAAVASAQRRSRTNAPRKIDAPTTQKTKPTAPVQTPARPTPTPSKKEKEDFEAERVFEELVSAEGYAFVVEMRKVGQLARSKEMKEILDVARSVGGEVKELNEAIDFFTSNAEHLSEANAYTLAMRTRTDLPEFIAAYQFASVEQARTIEPKVREMSDKYKKSFNDAEQASAAEEKPDAGQAAKSSRRTADKAQPAQSSLSFFIKRYGNLILMAESDFTLKKLKMEGEPSLAANARFQSLRSRLSTEPVFLYFDVELMGKGTQLIRESYEKQQAGMTEAEQQEIDKQADAEIARMEAEAKSAAEADAQKLAELTSPSITEPVEDAPPPPAVNIAEMEAQATGQQPDGEAQAALAAQSSNFLMGLLFSSFLGGAAQWPEAVGATLALDGDSIVVRALVVNPASNQVQPGRSLRRRPHQSSPPTRMSLSALRLI